MAPYYGFNNTNYTTWGYWTQGTTASTASTVWDQWHSVISTAGTAATSAQIWNGWNQVGYAYAPLQAAPVLTKKQERRRRANERRRGAEAAAAAAAHRAALAAKQAKAEELLLSVLDDTQQAELRKDGYFHIQTRDGERVYRLGPRLTPMRVKGEDGHRWSYCIHPRESFPAEDTVAALKLLIDHDEDEFLRIANASLAGAAR